jgi:acetyl esterase/lipase
MRSRVSISATASPARAGNLSGLPPTYIAVGSLDLFVDENIVYANRLLASGVPTELHVYPGAYHGFDTIPGTSLKEKFDFDCNKAMKAGLASKVGG